MYSFLASVDAQLSDGEYVIETDNGNHIAIVIELFILLYFAKCNLIFFGVIQYILYCSDKSEIPCIIKCLHISKFGIFLYIFLLSFSTESVELWQTQEGNAQRGKTIICKTCIPQFVNYSTSSFLRKMPWTRQTHCFMNINQLISEKIFQH